jgi:hypothetical protein
MTFGLVHRPFADFDDEVAPGTSHTVPPGAHASVGDEHSPWSVGLAGPLTPESLLGTLITTIRRELLVRGQDHAATQALDVAARTDLGWQDRDAMLRGHVLDHVPVLTVLDNFEGDLASDGDAVYMVRDEVLADLLAAWVADPGASRLLVTSRYPFTLPGGAGRALSFRQLGRCPGPRR